MIRVKIIGQGKVSIIMQTKQMIVFDSFVTVKFITGGEGENVDRAARQAADSRTKYDFKRSVWSLALAPS